MKTAEAARYCHSLDMSASTNGRLVRQFWNCLRETGSRAWKPASP